MNRNLTELVFIIDKSGSMCGLEKDTVGGFNSTIRRQLQEEGECIVSTVLFSNTQNVLHDRISLKDVPEMKMGDYIPSGTTALIDTVGGAIRHIKMVHRYIREEDRPARTLFVITTDGLENASHKYSLAQVKKMIEEQQKEGWEFIFMAANIDAYETAKDYGFREECVANVVSDREGVELQYQDSADAIVHFRHSGTINKCWKQRSEENYKKANKR